MPEPALREQQCYLYLEVPPSFPPPRMCACAQQSNTTSLTLLNAQFHTKIFYLSKRNPAKLLCSVEELRKEPLTINREGSRGNATKFAWKESGNPFRQNPLQFTQPGSNPDPSIFGSLAQHESIALDHAATEAVSMDFERLAVITIMQLVLLSCVLVSDWPLLRHDLLAVKGVGGGGEQSRALLLRRVGNSA
uniref:Uncharacterized protein n=1 Tax=Timema cristinae TaxID=61476 RepID=A0A7R9CJW0_TIMCR|nr:unnamed protein product [Timema cristinae]